MNANELADWIENGTPFGEYETAKQAVVMLRQQQAEIEALKVEHENLKRAYLILSGSLSNVTGGGK